MTLHSKRTQKKETQVGFSLSQFKKGKTKTDGLSVSDTEPDYRKPVQKITVLQEDSHGECS